MKLTGWKAVAALLAMAAFGYYSYSAREAALDTEAAERIRLEIASEFLRAELPGLKEAMESGDGEAASAIAKKITERNIEIRSISARGSGDDVIVRAEILVNGLSPADGKSVRYYRFSHSALIGWSLHWETWWPAYYSKLW